MKYKQMIKNGYFGGIFAILTTAIFLNLFSSENEIYPYYAVLLLFKKYDIKIVRFCLLIMIFSIFNFLILDHSRSIINGIISIVVLLSISVYHSLSKEDVSALCKVFKIFLFINFVVCFMQFLFPSFYSSINPFFSSRGIEHVLVLTERFAVSGLGPEPSYTGALICGITLTLYLNKSLNILDILIIFIQLVLMKSISAFIIILIYFIFMILLRKNISKKNIFKFLIAFLLVSFVALFSLYTRIESLLNAEIKIESLEDIINIESVWGSTRLQNIYSAIQLYNGDVGNGYSIGACLAFIFHGLILLIIALIITGFNIHTNFLNFIPFLILAIFTGPALIWPLYVMPWKKIKE